MKTISIIRHAHALAGFDDHSRRLSLHGEQIATQLGVQLKQAVWKPDLCCVSDSSRTQETAQLILNQITEFIQVFITNELYNANIQQILSFIEITPAVVSHLALIGHNPSMSELANLLNKNHVHNLSPGGIVILAVDIDDWQNIRDRV